MNVAAYQAKVYPNPPCWELVADVYLTELAQQVEQYRTVSDSVRSIASAFRLTLHKGAHGFVQVAEPQDYAIVLMGRSAAVGVHHAGIWWQDRVLHAQETETLYQDAYSLRALYPLMEFWVKPT